MQYSQLLVCRLSQLYSTYNILFITFHMAFLPLGIEG